jgi:hypothetical protein
MIEIHSTLSCPECGKSKTEQMPTESQEFLTRPDSLGYAKQLR